MQYLSHKLSLDLSQTLIQTLSPGRCTKAQRWTKAGRSSLVRWRTTPPGGGGGGGGPHGQSLACLPSRQRVGAGQAGRGSSFWLEVDVREEVQLLYSLSTFVCQLTGAQTKKERRSLSLPSCVANSLYRAANWETLTYYYRVPNTQLFTPIQGPQLRGLVPRSWSQNR